MADPHIYFSYRKHGVVRYLAGKAPGVHRREVNGEDIVSSGLCIEVGAGIIKDAAVSAVRRSQVLTRRSVRPTGQGDRRGRELMQLVMRSGGVAL